MSRKEEFKERVQRMADRNGLLTKVIDSTGAVEIYGQGNETVKVTASMASRPCRVVIHFANGGVQTEPWMLLEALCRNLALGVVR